MPTLKIDKKPIDAPYEFITSVALARHENGSAECDAAGRLSKRPGSIFIVKVGGSHLILAQNDITTTSEGWQSRAYDTEGVEFWIEFSRKE